MTKEKPKPIIILGMHRSGTSCLAGALQQAGLYLGKVSEYNTYNKKGNRENNEIMHLNDSILDYNNSSWDAPPKKPLKWTQEHIAIAKKIISTFEQQTPTGYWGFKDPRTLLTFPFWEKLLTKPVFIGSFRHPLLVAHSVCKREDFSQRETAALSLWSTYNNILMSHIDKYNIQLIAFDQPSPDYKKKLKKIARFLGLPAPEKIDFYDETLIQKDNSTFNENNINSELSSLYEKILKQKL